MKNSVLVKTRVEYKIAYTVVVIYKSIVSVRVGCDDFSGCAKINDTLTHTVTKRHK